MLWPLWRLSVHHPLMSEKSPTFDEIMAMLRQPMPDDIRQFACIHLYSYRDEAMHAARSDAPRERREALVAEARRRLRDKLRRLLAWAKERGRI